MAKRKRLGMPDPDRLRSSGAPAPEARPAGLAGPAPIAQVAGEAASAASADSLAEELRSARVEGRMIQALPLERIEIDYLVRDRIAAEDEDLVQLMRSIRERGQQTPIEVVDLGQGRYGLISGWRRVTALKRLFIETGEGRFAAVQALLRQPKGAAEAYRAMVEENEIRVGLSYYERARIAARAAKAGIHPDASAAIKALFAAASPAKRSKIASFLVLHDALDGYLQFPAAIPERLGLELARALRQEAGLQRRLRDRLRKTPPEDVRSETNLLEAALKGGEAAAASGKAGPPAAEEEEIAPGIRLRREQRGGELVLTLKTAEDNRPLESQLRAWLQKHWG